MINKVAKIEIKGHEKRVYELYYRADSPLGEVYDALAQMQRYVMQEMKLEDQKKAKE